MPAAYEAYRVSAEVHGYLVFSSVVMPAVRGRQRLGSLIAPSHYIHNYPLFYALQGYPAETYVGADLEYRLVRDMLERVLLDRGPWFYVFPLSPVEVRTRLVLLSSESWSYALPVRNPTKNIFPRLVNYLAIAPGSKFETIVLSKGVEWGRRRYVRVGKKRWGVMRLDFEPLEEAGEGSGGARATVAINLGDARALGIRLSRFVKVLETPATPSWNREAGVVVRGTVERYRVYRDRDGRRHVVPTI